MRERGVSITGPFILIGAGIILLLEQLNIIQWSFWEVAFRFWPLIIVAVGADVLFARRSFVGAVVSLLAVLGLLVGGIYLLGPGTPQAGGQPLTADQVAYELGDADSGVLSVSMDAGQLLIDALPEDSANVVAGTIHHTTAQEVSSNRSVSGGRVTVSIRNNWPRTYLFRDDRDFTWDLGITPNVPVSLDLSLGAGQIVVDLTKVKAGDVTVKLGAGKVILKLPGNRNLNVSVSIGAGSAEIELPSRTALQAHCTTGVGNCALPNGSGFWGQSYTSPEFSGAETKVTVDISIGVGEGSVSVG